MLFNINRGKGQQAKRPSDFMPDYGIAKPKPKPMDGRKVWDNVNQVMMALGGVAS